MMKIDENTALKTAEFLLQIKAIKLNPQQPFTWASGWKSPIYCDNRKTLSYPKIRNYLREKMTSYIQEEFGSVEVIAGVATGGIALGALVAQDLGLPFVYVRSQSKAHGLENKVEGVLESDQTVVVIEDLISTGGSSLKAVEALRSAGANVKGMIAIFTYGFQVAAEAFEEANCPVYTLSDYNMMINKALSDGYVKESEAELLSKWRLNPDTWGK
jgi:orotate phosphoribosyltransferase